MESLGDRLEFVIGLQRMFQKDFAKSVKTDATHINKIIKGINQPSDKLLDLICEKYNINFKWLKFGEGEMYKDSNLSSFPRALEIFKKLDTNYQDYVYHVLEKLVELQEKNKNS